MSWGIFRVLSFLLRVTGLSKPTFRCTVSPDSETGKRKRDQEYLSMLDFKRVENVFAERRRKEHALSKVFFIYDSDLHIHRN